MAAQRRLLLRPLNSTAARWRRSSRSAAARPTARGPPIEKKVDAPRSWPRRTACSSPSELHSRAVASSLQVSSRPSDSSRPPQDCSPHGCAAPPALRPLNSTAARWRRSSMSAAARPTARDRPLRTAPAHGRAGPPALRPLNSTAARWRPRSMSAAARPTARDRPRRRAHGRAVFFAREAIMIGVIKRLDRLARQGPIIFPVLDILRQRPPR